MCILMCINACVGRKKATHIWIGGREGGSRVGDRDRDRIYNCGLTTNRQFDKMGHTQKEVDIL